MIQTQESKTKSVTGPLRLLMLYGLFILGKSIIKNESETIRDGEVKERRSICHAIERSLTMSLIIENRRVKCEKVLPLLSTRFRANDKWL